MRCKACNKNLSDEESVRKDSYGYLDLCNRCYHSVSDDEVVLKEDDSVMPELEDNHDPETISLITEFTGGEFENGLE